MGKKAKEKQKKHQKTQQKRSDKERKRQKQAKQQKKKISSVTPQERLSMEDFTKLLFRSDRLLHLPELADFVLPSEPIIAHLNDLARRFPESVEGDKEPTQEELIAHQEGLLLAGLTPEAQEELAARLTQVARKNPQINVTEIALIQTILEVFMVDKPDALVIIPFFQELMQRSVKHVLAVTQRQDMLMEELSQKAFGVSDARGLPLHEIRERLQDPALQPVLREFMRKNPDFEELSNAASDKMVDHVIEAIDQGVFDAVLLPDADIEQFIDMLPPERTHQWLIQQKKLTKKDQKIFSKTFHEFIHVYENEGKAKKFLEVLRKERDRLDKTGDVSIAMYETALFLFTKPLVDNPLFFPLFRRSWQVAAEKQKQEAKEG